MTALRIFTACLVLAAPAARSAEPGDPLEKLRTDHPRLLIEPNAWSRLKQNAAADADLRALLAKLEEDARWLADQPPLKREMIGRRLLDVSRQAIQRILIWSLIRHHLDDASLAARAEKEMLALAAFPDWNPDHFLDTAEMTTALAIGLDWLHADLSPAARTTIREAIVQKGLRPGLEIIRGGRGWPKSTNNWNQVCFGGLTLGALAVAESHPAEAREILTAARKDIHHGLEPYAPDGIYPEGPGYWIYGTSYQCLMISALESATGNSWDMTRSPGFLGSARVQTRLLGPSGSFFNFFDCQESPSIDPAMFWFARKLDDPSLVVTQHDLLTHALKKPISSEKPYRENRFMALIPLWWVKASPSPAPAHEAAWLGQGPNPVGIFRSSPEPDASWLAFKGGSASLSHAHADAGSFVFDALGIRWACDLRHQNYHSLESKGIRLWDSGQNGQRWTVYRTHNRVHNTLTIDDDLHQVKASIRIPKIDRTPAPSATLEITDLFPEKLASAHRTFELDGTRAIITDQIRGLDADSRVTWNLTTATRVTAKGSEAIFQSGGKSLLLRVISPADAVVTTSPATPPDDGFNEPNPGRTLVRIQPHTPASGNLEIKVELIPQNGSPR
ncbi:MAG: heparinase II/III-family protein [Akkermansiaceae bacterium]|jgi:hypothetical protein|nr:heparinase II/III-family protein [Akkermansiaceae bacterium]